MTEHSKVLKFVGINRSKPMPFNTAIIGLKKSSIESFARHSRLRLTEILQLLEIPPLTFSRWASDKQLPLLISDRILQLAALYAHGVTVLGGLDEFNGWLDTHLIALDGKKPKDLLNSSFGIERVHELCDALAYGNVV